MGAILLEVADQPTPEARERYLDQVCAHDPELRAQVGLLRAHVSVRADKLVELGQEGVGVVVGGQQGLEPGAQGGVARRRRGRATRAE